LDFKKLFKPEKPKDGMKRGAGGGMKRGVGNHILIGLLIVAVVLLALFFLGDRGFTGFAVFEQQNQSDFDKGSYTGVEYNGSAVVLSSGQNIGTYTSEIFDANSTMQWDSLIWQGGIPGSYNVFLTSATHNGNSVTEVASQDGVFYLADMSNSSNFDLDFASDLTSSSVLKIYAKMNKSEVVGVYAQSDTSGNNALGTFTVTSSTGELIEVTLNLGNSTSAIWFGEGAGSGVAPAEEFDYIFAEVPTGADLTFQVRVCSSSDCANESFVTVSDLTNIGLEGRYFQYQADFTSSDSSLSPYLESVVVGSSLGIVSLNISEPTGIKSSQTGISISFTKVGNNLTCWYNINNGINTTLPGCSSSSFDVSDDGNYVFNLYANNSLGASDYQSSSFTVDTPPPSSSPEKTSEESNITGTTTEVTEIVKLILEDIPSQTMNPGETREITWSVESVLTFPLQACLFESVGEVSSWINHTETLDLNAGEKHTFVFNVVVPEGTAAGSYGLGVSLDCPGTDVADLFTVEVVEKKLEFGLISVERTEQNEVEVTYSLEELSGEDQNVEIGLSLLKDIEKVAEVSTSQALAANALEEFLAVVPVDEALEGELTLVADLNSEIYSASVQERVVISGTPTAGFAIFGGEGGAGGFIIFLIVVVVLVAIFFIVRYMRKSGVSLKDFLRFKFRQ